jgi:diaminopimelate epimerase
VNAASCSGDRSHVRLRVYERGAGETLACGTGACAAVVAGIRLGPAGCARGRAHARRPAHHRLGGQEADSVFLTGPAVTVFEGQIDIPDAP